MSAFANTPEPPYYAVIFTSERTGTDATGYAEAAAAMLRLAAAQPGYLGVETVRDPETGLGITVSYWQSVQAITAWKENAEHLAVQRLGRERWYAGFAVRIARVERADTWQEAAR